MQRTTRTRAAGRTAATIAALAGAQAAAQTDGLERICGDCVFEKFASCGGFLEGATVDAEGTLWVVDLLSGNLLSVDDGGRCDARANTGGQPNGAKFHRDGRLFVADKTLGIVAYDPSSDEITTIADTYRAERLRGTNDLVFDAEGGLYFTEPYGSSATNPTGRVFYLPPGENASPVLAADGLAFPNGVALSPDGGNIFVGEYAKKHLLSAPAVGSPDVFDIAYVFARTVGGVGPDGMALDEDGNIYVAIFQGGAVDVIAPDGRPRGTLMLPDDAGTFVTNLAFHEGWLYVTEASVGEIWRVRVSSAGLPLFHQTE
ncbi:MAG: SMP-30/gluconolactonase/LRE family protein [Gammaproteobacteria bacterium]|nr:SMP-30/gluconolactonase/LRE family protein [Gammaproteobacteria bacterium]